MQFRTQIPIEKGNRPIDYKSSIVSLGSCFAVNIAQKFDYYQFKNTVNPFGILFHPLAIEKFLQLSADEKNFGGSDVFLHNERWHCFDAHSDLSHADEKSLLGNLNSAALNTNVALREATHVIITLGTAWAYRHAASGQLVANCHKVSQNQFTKELLPVQTIVESMLRTLELIEKHNPEASVILTVSPVRHIKDGFAGNQRSKAHLIAAIHEVVDLHSRHRQPAANHHKTTYFPSYEIMMDELRDYRFYADDMLHPSVLAIDYIWEKFAAAWISPDAFPTIEAVATIRKALAHRPFNPNSDSHQKFLKSIDERITALQRDVPHISF